jgi:hypothetical protein
MAITTNVPLPTFTTTGLQTSSEQAILAGVLADWQAAFASVGKTMNPSLTTLQGQLISSESYMVAAFQALLSQFIALVDPRTSFGIFQDAIGDIYFITRQAATFAVIDNVTVTGNLGQVLPAGLQATSPDGSIWLSANAVTCDSITGNASVDFVASVAGSAPVCAANALKIYQAYAGWNGLVNATPSVAGTDVESRTEFETRRGDSVAINSVGQPASVFGAVANVPGVTDAYIYNNGTGAPVVIGSTSYSVPAHSIYIGVAGSAAQSAIVQAINSRVDCGCGFATSAGLGTLIHGTYQDTVNYQPPYPTYPINYVVPAPTQCYVAVQVANLSTLPANYQVQVQNAIVAAFENGWVSGDGTINIPRARIGAQVVADQWAATVLALGNIVPVSFAIGLTSSPTALAITFGVDQLPQISTGNITVTAVTV